MNHVIGQNTKAISRDISTSKTCIMLLLFQNSLVINTIETKPLRLATSLIVFKTHYGDSSCDLSQMLEMLARHVMTLRISSQDCKLY